MRYSVRSVWRPDSHKYIVLLHDLVEVLIPSIDFMEPVIVNVRHHHLGKTREKWSELHYRRTVEYFPVSGKQFLRFLMGFHRVWTGRCTGLLRYPVWGPPRGTVIHNTNVVFNMFLSQLTDNCDMFYFHLPVWVWTEGPSVPGKPPLSGLFSLAGVKWGSRMGQRWRTPWSTLGTPTLTWKGHEKYPLWWSHSSNGGWSRLPWQQSVIVPTTSRKRIKFDTRKTMTTKNTCAERSLKTKFKASN